MWIDIFNCLVYTQTTNNLYTTMAKDRRKKKYFQGMEHLQHTTITSPTTAAGASQESLDKEHAFVRRDLIGVLVIMAVIAGILTGLTILDKKTDRLTVFAEKITSAVVK